MVSPARYLKEKAKVLAYEKKRRLKRIYEARGFVIRYLLKHPCVDCGFKDVRVLEFDHVRGKKRANISKLTGQGKSEMVIAREIAKCDVRCVRCHRLRHFREARWNPRRYLTKG